MSKRLVFLTPEQEHELAALVEQGTGVDAAAKQLGLSVVAARRFAAHEKLAGRAGPVMSRMRRCCRCGQTKALDQFVRNVGKPGGRDYTCLACKSGPIGP